MKNQQDSKKFSLIYQLKETERQKPQSKTDKRDTLEFSLPFTLLLLLYLNDKVQAATPVAQGDEIVIEQGQETIIDVVANDKLGPTTEIKIVENPGNGILTVNDDGTLTYTPIDLNAVEDNFSYYLVDAEGNVSGVADVKIKLNPRGDIIAETNPENPPIDDLPANDFPANPDDVGGAAAVGAAELPNVDEGGVLPIFIVFGLLALGIGGAFGGGGGGGTLPPILLPPGPGMPEVSIAAIADGIEGSANGQFEVSLSQASLTDTTINYTVMGTATEGVDHDILSKMVTISAGMTSAFIDVNVIDDASIEGDETVTVKLDSPIASGDPAIIIGAPDMASVIIFDNDNIVSIKTAMQAAESNIDGQFKVSLLEASLVNTTISYVVVGGSATENTDYSLPLVKEVTIPAGMTSAFINVTVIDDGDSESPETVEVMLMSIVAGNSNINVDGTSAIVTIADDDPEPPPLFDATPNTVDFNDPLYGTYQLGTQYDALDDDDTVTLADTACAAILVGFDPLNTMDGSVGTDLLDQSATPTSVELNLETDPGSGVTSGTLFISGPNSILYDIINFENFTTTALADDIAWQSMEIALDAMTPGTPGNPGMDGNIGIGPGAPGDLGMPGDPGGLGNNGGNAQNAFIPETTIISNAGDDTLTINASASAGNGSVGGAGGVGGNGGNGGANIGNPGGDGGAGGNGGQGGDGGFGGFAIAQINPSNPSMFNLGAGIDTVMIHVIAEGGIGGVGGDGGAGGNGGMGGTGTPDGMDGDGGDGGDGGNGGATQLISAIISGSTFDLGDGNDVLMLSALSIGGDAGDGGDGGIGGDGDLSTGTGGDGGNGGNGLGGGIGSAESEISMTNIIGGAGNDDIDILVEATGSNGGDGGDGGAGGSGSIAGMGGIGGNGGNAGGGTARFADNNISGDAGNDTIDIVVIGTAGTPGLGGSGPGGTGTDGSISQSTISVSNNIIDGGADNDSLSLIAAVSFPERIPIIFNNQFIGGDGDDTLNLDITLASPAFFFLNSIIGGAGNDTITSNVIGFNNTYDGGAGLDDTLDLSTVNGDITIGLIFNSVTNSGVSSTVLNIENVVTGDGDDTLISDNANNIFTGGLGDDTFDFRMNSGQDTITDFNTNGEIIDLSNYSISFGDLTNSGINSNADTLVDIDGTNTITLMGVNFNTIDATDFNF